MSQLVLERVENHRGLDQLVQCVQRGTPLSGLSRWLDKALLQVEHDESLDPHISDDFVSIIEATSEAHTAGLATAPYLQLLAELHRKSHQAPSLQSQWAQKRADFADQDIETDMWVDFLDALELAKEGDTDSCYDWLSEQEECFLAVWSEYEGQSILDSEITSESALGHAYLRDGVETWLEAIAMLKDSLEIGQPDLDTVKAKAREAQCYLVAVQLLEEKVQADRQFYFSHHN